MELHSNVERVDVLIEFKDLKNREIYSLPPSVSRFRPCQRIKVRHFQEPQSYLGSLHNDDGDVR
jgi:hypothetical protein